MHEGRLFNLLGGLSIGVLNASDKVDKQHFNPYLMKALFILFISSYSSFFIISGAIRVKICENGLRYNYFYDFDSTKL